MSDSLKIVTHEDSALAKKPPVRVAEQEAWIDVDPSKLTDLLDDIDGLKYEIHERMRRIEAVRQAKSVLLEDLLKTEALNKKLAELGQAMGGAHLGLRLTESEFGDTEPTRMQFKEASREAGSRQSEARILTDGVALPWRKPEEFVDPSGNACQTPRSSGVSDGYKENREVVAEARIAFNAALERLEEAEQSWKRSDQTVLDARRLLDESTARLDRAVSREEQTAADFRSTQEALAIAHQSANERIEEAERSWRQADQVTLEARRLLDQSTAELVQARRREEAVAADLQTVRLEFAAAYQSATQHLEKAELFWQRGDQAAVEARKMLDRSAFELTEARSKEELASADLLSARQELTTAYQFAAVAAQRRMDAVEFFQKATRWVIFSVSFSWIAMVWLAWLLFRVRVPVWGPGIVTAIIVVLAIVLGRRGTRED